MTISAEQAAKLLEGTTPGPWYRDAWDIRAPSPGTGAVCEVASPNGDDNQYWRDGESDANARLIAAAPDLAAALIASEDARKLAEERLAKLEAEKAALGQAVQAVCDTAKAEIDRLTDALTTIAEGRHNMPAVKFARRAILKEIDND